MLMKSFESMCFAYILNNCRVVDDVQGTFGHPLHILLWNVNDSPTFDGNCLYISKDETAAEICFITKIPEHNITSQESLYKLSPLPTPEPTPEPTIYPTPIPPIPTPEPERVVVLSPVNHCGFMRGYDINLQAKVLPESSTQRVKWELEGESDDGTQIRGNVLHLSMTESHYYLRVVVSTVHNPEIRQNLLYLSLPSIHRNLLLILC